MTSGDFVFKNIDLNPCVGGLVEIWDDYIQFCCGGKKTLRQEMRAEMAKPVSHLLLGRSEPLPLERPITIRKTAAVGTTEQMMTAFNTARLLRLGGSVLWMRP